MERPAGPVAKDPEADAMINQAVQANPDAAYLLVQHAILADQALHAAQAQLQALQGRQQAGSFLPVQTQSYSPPQPYDPEPGSPWAGQGGSPVQSSPFSANSGLGSFLRSAGTMAAGVAAGDFLAQGLSNLFAPRW
jgi:hypothetical protein